MDSTPTSLAAIEFTKEELRALRTWLDAIGFQGVPKDLARALALHAGIVGKVEAQLARLDRIDMER